MQSFGFKLMCVCSRQREREEGERERERMYKSCQQCGSHRGAGMRRGLGRCLVLRGVDSSGTQGPTTWFSATVRVTPKPTT